MANKVIMTNSKHINSNIFYNNYDIGEETKNNINCGVSIYEKDCQMLLKNIREQREINENLFIKEMSKLGEMKAQILVDTYNQQPITEKEKKYKEKEKNMYDLKNIIKKGDILFSNSDKYVICGIHIKHNIYIGYIIGVNRKNELYIDITNIEDTYDNYDKLRTYNLNKILENGKIITKNKVINVKLLCIRDNKYNNKHSNKYSNTSDEYSASYSSLKNKIIKKNSIKNSNTIDDNVNNYINLYGGKRKDDDLPELGDDDKSSDTSDLSYCE